jgi:hypothetical protein
VRVGRAKKGWGLPDISRDIHSFEWIPLARARVTYAAPLRVAIGDDDGRNTQNFIAKENYP